MASRDGCPEFSMFEKMTNCTKNWTCREFSKIKEWVATEKIHGSNFSLTVWEEDHEVVVKMAKRSSYLGDEENFFNVRRQAALVQEMEECSRRVWLSVQKQESEVEAVVVYGELFGGTSVAIEKCTVPLLHSYQWYAWSPATQDYMGYIDLTNVPILIKMPL